jgi:predicted branched-subunit amino acid permease
VLRNAIGISVATGAYAVSFGAVAVTAGLSVVQTCATSLLVFTGASQFALVAVLGAGGAVFSGVLSAWLLGTRNALYAVRMADLLQLRGARRVAAAQLTIDESTAMAIAAPVGLERLGFFATGIGIYLLWNLGTLLGALGAAHLGDPARFGLDAAVPAAFVALLAPRLRDREAAGAALLGAALALVAVPFVRPGVPVLLAGLAVLPLLARR